MMTLNVALVIFDAAPTAYNVTSVTFIAALVTSNFIFDDFRNNTGLFLGGTYTFVRWT